MPEIELCISGYETFNWAENAFACVRRAGELQEKIVYLRVLIVVIIIRLAG
jgi:hypothetical protein